MTHLDELALFEDQLCDERFKVCFQLGDERFIPLDTNDDRVHRRKVALGFLEGWRIQVTEGLSAGEKVIVVGHRSVNDGDPVNVVRVTTDPEDILN